MIEKIQPAPPEFAVDKKPFVIRGHHLEEFADLLKDNGVDTNFLARRARAGIRSLPFYEQYIRISREQAREYVADVLGEDEYSGQEFEKRTAKMFERFFSLPDNHPAEVTDNIPDDMCKACIIGKHCTSKNFLTISELDRRNITTDYDINHVTEFLQVVDFLELPKPEIIKDTAHFSDAEPEVAIRALTTMGTVRKALAYMYE